MAASANFPPRHDPPAPVPSDSSGLDELVRMALDGTNVEFQQVARLCEDEGVALSLLRGLRMRRSQVNGWLDYLAELHPELVERHPSE